VSLAAVCIEKYGKENGVPAVFQILYFIGWKPDKSQVTLLICHQRPFYTGNLYLESPFWNLARLSK